MTVTVNQFLKHLITSRLMSMDEVQAFLSSLDGDQHPQDGEAFARKLVQKKKLTVFQATAIYRGKPHGLVLGDYTLLDRIGVGGMGQVFKAMHHRMERVVALKVLPAKTMNSPDAIQRFQREVKAAAKLSHPNIVTAFDAREDGGVYSLVMEFVDGVDLARLVTEKGPLEVGRALDYIVQAARGLEHAHLQGVVHRDIKPANLLLDKQGAIKILDMGLARLQEGAVGTVSAAAGLTNVGSLMGTIDFMSPEQALDCRQAACTSDIYSLGCTLYVLLIGHPVFIGETIMARILAHRESPPPSLRAERKDIPAAVDVAFRRMVAKKVEDRFQSMTEVIAALTNLKNAPAAESNTDEIRMPSHVLKAIFDDE
ncbi:MAG: serine/threonine protein kinase [Planctomycetales bacterium]|nr:serine/threonine protein kinase [Planctomycetales bacterium]